MCHSPPRRHRASPRSLRLPERPCASEACRYDAGHWCVAGVHWVEPLKVCQRTDASKKALAKCESTTAANCKTDKGCKVRESDGKCVDACVREYDPEKECVQVWIGNSRGNTRTVDTAAAWYTRQRKENVKFSINDYVCPALVRKTNWNGGYTYNDKFRVSQNGNKVSAKRTDSRGGWGMQLRFHCCIPHVTNDDCGTDAQPNAIQIASGKKCTNTKKTFDNTASLDDCAARVSKDAACGTAFERNIVSMSCSCLGPGVACTTADDSNVNRYQVQKGCEYVKAKKFSYVSNGKLYKDVTPHTVAPNVGHFCEADEHCPALKTFGANVRSTHENGCTEGHMMAPGTTCKLKCDNRFSLSGDKPKAACVACVQAHTAATLPSARVPGMPRLSVAARRHNRRGRRDSN